VNLRRLVLDVDKALARPSLLEIAEAIAASAGVEALNVTVDDIDVETVGMMVTIEGTNLDYDQIVRAIEHSGAVVHGIEQIVAGDRIVEHIGRAR
jgi:hypothetical protein